MVPARDADLPGAQLPDGTDASGDPRFKTTDAKRYLGKQIFHDPPGRSESIRVRWCPGDEAIWFVRGAPPRRMASKAGTLLNFNVALRGRSYTGCKGQLHSAPAAPGRYPAEARDMPLFPGDAWRRPPTLNRFLRDRGGGQSSRGASCRTRARCYEPAAGCLGQRRAHAPVCSNRVQQPRLAGGFAGEPDSSPGGLNRSTSRPGKRGAALIDAHRMLSDDHAKPRSGH